MTSDLAQTAARCGVHPDANAVGLCTRCGTFACAACARTGEAGAFFCASCEPYGGESIPWERREELGLVRAFVDTTKLAVLSPSKFYAIPPRDGSALPSMGYGLVFVVLAGLVNLLSSLTFGRDRMNTQLGPMREALAREFPAVAENLDALYSGGLVIGFVASPLQLVVNLYTGAALTWLGLKLTGNMRSSFARLVRGLAYMSWVNLFSSLMIIDHPIAQLAVGLVMLCLMSAHWVILVRESQRISTGAAVMSSLVSTAVAFSLCCVFIIIPVVAIVAASAASLAGH